MKLWLMQNWIRELIVNGHYSALYPYSAKKRLSPGLNVFLFLVSEPHKSVSPVTVYRESASVFLRRIALIILEDCSFLCPRF